MSTGSKVNSPGRGDIVRVRLDPTEGSEQAGTRPALVLSPNAMNAHAPIVLIAPITSRKTERIYPYEALVEPPEGGLSERSKVLLLHMRGIDKRRITRIEGRVGQATMARVEEAVKLVTGLAGI